ncbi:MAG: C1 family peptidase [Desulfarculaceae bacterium]|jgi:C1A family cysteine protease
MAENIKHYKMGWLPDYPSIRDYTVDQTKITTSSLQRGQKKSVSAMLKQVGVIGAPKAPSLPANIDLRPWCPPVEDQKDIGSCTANAGVGLVEYFEIRAFDKYIDASRLFLYKVTRNLMHVTGDTGAYLRSTMGAMVLFGVPPEEYWKYDTSQYDVEPSAFCYAYAQNYQAISYYRLDPAGTDKSRLLKQIKTNLAAKLPSMFGFTVYNSIGQASHSGEIPFPADTEIAVGGHAVVAMGYDDAKKIKNNIPGSKTYTGALLIRNSWDTTWGDGGYGWLPYEYVLTGQAIDWWSLLKSEWIDTKKFGFG